MANANPNRHNYLFRLDEHQRAELGERAAKQGLSVQQYLELAALGDIRPRRKGGRPFKTKDQEALLEIAS
jgi:hypothetical protein